MVFARAYLGSASASFPSTGSTRPGAGRRVTAASARRVRFPRRPAGLSGSWGTPVYARPVLRPRQDRKRQAQYGARSVAPVCGNYVGSCDDKLSGLNSMARRTRCLRFVTAVARRHARLASGCGPALPGRIGCLPGSAERFPGYIMFPFLLSQDYPDAMPLLGRKADKQ